MTDLDERFEAYFFAPKRERICRRWRIIRHQFMQFLIGIRIRTPGSLKDCDGHNRNTELLPKKKLNSSLCLCVEYIKSALVCAFLKGHRDHRAEPRALRSAFGALLAF